MKTIFLFLFKRAKVTVILAVIAGVGLVVVTSRRLK